MSVFHPLMKFSPKRKETVVKLLRIFIIIISFAMFLSACSNQEEAHPKLTSKENTLMVYTTVYPLQFFTQKIGGEFVEVNTIYPPGADEHTFEPSQKDMMNLADADLFFYIGLGLEGFVDKVLHTLKNEHVTLVATGEHIQIEQTTNLGKENHTHGDIDPHVWLDPLYAIELADAIKVALINVLPEQKAYFEENFLKLEQDLHALHQDFSQMIDNAKRTEFIVSHAAYGYWEKRYHLKQINISGISTSSEPSQKQLEKLIKTAKNKKITYVLVEQNVNSQLANIVKNELEADTLTLHNLGVLTNKDIQNKEDYFSLMKKNMLTLEKALH